MVPEVPNLEAIPASEQKVYVALDKALPEEYRVFHSVCYYVGPDGRAPLREGEADFVILHPERGLLVLEVKGGGVKKDRDGRWYSTGRNGKEIAIDDPFRQVQQNEKSLASEIKKRLDTQLIHGHAVVFPDCDYRLDDEKQPLGQPRFLVLDASDLAGNVRGAVDRVYAHWAAGRPASSLDPRTLKKLSQNVLAPRFQLGLSLGTAIAEEESALCRLSYEQETCLDFLTLNPRCVVEGGAGTGKTFIALEVARAFAAWGGRVLFLCFNRPLAALLRQKCAEFEVEPGSIWAGTFHELCREWAHKAGIEWSEPDGATGPETEHFYNIAAPEKLRAAAEKIPDRFDALVVDEAQDFLTEWWPDLLSLLRRPNLDPFVTFCDAEQDLWDRNSRIPGPLPRFPLHLNQRNTHSISDFFAPLGSCHLRHTLDTPWGEPPVEETYRNPGHERQLAEGRIGHLLLREKLDMSRIAVLGTHHLDRSFLAGEPSLCGFPIEAIDDCGRVSPGAIRYATPRRFKGLEADVVLLCDVDGAGHAGTRRDLYVAASRARHRLYIYRAKHLPIVTSVETCS